MRSTTEAALLSQVSSAFELWCVSIICGVAVFLIAVSLQWLIYEDWLHRSGPLRLVGSVVAFLITFVFAFRWQLVIRRRKIETLRRFETIRWMNDRIRNSLQAIECVVYARNQHVTDPVREAVDTIEEVLDEVLTRTGPGASPHISRLQHGHSAGHP